MKNIILIDRDLSFIDVCLELQHHIVVLIVDSHSMAEEVRAKYQNNPQITHIMSMQELEYVNGTSYLSYELLNQYKLEQYKVEFVAHRWLNDGMLSTNKFINALCFWNHIFDSFSIDLVFISGLEHGVSYDIPAYIAKHRSIPAFFTPPTLIYAISVLHFNTNTYVPLLSGNLSDSQIQENLFYHFNPDDIVLPTATSLWKKQKSLIRSLLLKIGGQLLVDFVLCVLKRDFIIKQHTGYFPTSFWERLSSLLYVKKLKRFYYSIMQAPDYSEKFIFYAMHFEPEGGTSVCVNLQNQLSIIQMLHNALPEGYKLYIKEHPHQFMLNNPEMVYFLYNIKWWKSIAFYKELQALEHVKIIDFNTPSKELITHAQALATINGTIHIEATFYNKPCIAFAGKSLLLYGVKNLICVESFEELQKNLTILASNPSYFDNKTTTPPRKSLKPTRHIIKAKLKGEIYSAPCMPIFNGLIPHANLHNAQIPPYIQTPPYIQIPSWHTLYGECYA
ncbi:hypothetical protein [Helicobacter marmotae]|uniref:hypothetical protein n=1 Tax=Helicobacter marmotae TaxID=152490 RepID=UPI001F30C21F|nr:hypothetical protein [Helicobacter marmotae]